MKAFKGTLVAAVALGLTWGAIQLLDPAPEQVAAPEAEPLFAFEKVDLIRVEIKRPDDALVLVETDDGWFVEGPDFTASRSMVNRVKHQLHDLTARANVIEEPEDFALYGLGPQAITVTLNFRDGGVTQFRAGDPNPSSVSYYIQPIPGDTVYIVKKSAVDYYSFTIDDFRERRFATFDSKEADTLQAELSPAVIGAGPGGAGRTLSFRRVDERNWEMLAPSAMDASRDEVRGLMGRVSAMKAWSFVADLPAEPAPADLAPYGLGAHRARITVGFGSRPPLVLRVGDPLSPAADEEMAYATVEGEWTVYQVKHDLLNDYAEDPVSFRNERFVKLHHDQVIRAEATLRPGPDDPAEGEAAIQRGVDKWQWADGRPYAGSTAERVVIRTTGLRAEEYFDDAALARYGLATPRARIALTVEGGEERVVLIGDEGPPRQMEEREIRRYYAQIEGEPTAYLTDRGALDVVQDLIREHGRKADRDEDIEKRHEAIEKAQEDAP